MISGKLTVNQLIDDLKSIYTDPEASAPPYPHWNLKLAAVSLFSYSGYQRPVIFVASNRGLDGTSKTAIVAEDEFTFGLVIVYGLSFEISTLNAVIVFNDYNQIVGWLLP